MLDVVEPVADLGPAVEGLPQDYDDLEVSEFGLDWGDISLIRAKLELSPIERLRAAQDLVGWALRTRATHKRLALS